MAKLYIGNTAYKVMLGNNSGHIADLPTVVWNQLVTNGDFSQGLSGWSFDNAPTVSAENNELTIVYTATFFQRAKHSISMIAGHKYIVFCSINAPASLLQYAFFILSNVTENINNTYAGKYHRYSKIFTATKSALDTLLIADKQQKNNTGEAKVRNCMFIDLTLMFGAGNEPTSVAQFEQWFADNIGSLDNYYPYNEGEEIKVKYLPQYMLLT